MFSRYFSTERFLNCAPASKILATPVVCVTSWRGQINGFALRIIAPVTGELVALATCCCLVSGGSYKQHSIPLAATKQGVYYLSSSPIDVFFHCITKRFSAAKSSKHRKYGDVILPKFRQYIIAVCKQYPSTIEIILLSFRFSH